MPAGSKWCTTRPDLLTVPTVDLWRIHDRTYAASAANPRSKARLALRGTHAMLYAADSLAGALWETLLRHSQIQPGRIAEFDLSRLDGQVASRIRLRRDDLPLLELGRPGLLALFPDGNGPEVQAVNRLLATPKHRGTHAEARRLFQDLQAVGVSDMPVLSWPSRQFPRSTVYLAYEPPMDDTWWEELGDPIALDDPDTGHKLLQRELAAHGFTWKPISSAATEPSDDTA